MSGLVPGRPRTAGEAIEHMVDEALQQAEAERLAELREHPKQVEMKYLIDGREATQEELEDLSMIAAEQEEAHQQFLGQLMRVHQRAKWWLGIAARVDARHQRLVTA